MTQPPNPSASARRVALVCDWLTTPGGAEKVLLELHRMYPSAPIYTSQYSKKGIDWFDDATVKTGWLQIFPRTLRKFLGPLRQLYFSHLDLSEYDLVISVTGAEAKAIRTRQSAFHLCYCHVPTQYYWQMYDHYVENPGFGLLNPFVRFFFKLLVKPLRKADYQAAQNPDQFVTISHYAKDQIQKYYHRTAAIVAPPVAVEQFATPAPKPPTKSSVSPQSASSTSTQYLVASTDAPYYIIACRQVTWKRVDLAIKACLKAGVHLKVVGDGPEHDRLVRLANASDLIEFIPWVDSAELAQLLQSATAYLFPSLEPFGIAAVEALAAGCPVIAYQDGGSRDFVENGKNGLLFSAQTADSLASAIAKFQTLHFDRTKISRSAAAFSTDHFRQGITQLVDSALKTQKEQRP